MSMHWFTFRQGDRSEYLALYMLSALGLAVPVPRQEDVGIDFHCNLARQDGDIITYFAPYNVQVKSASVKCIKYGGESKKKKKGKPREWKKQEIDWILSQETPFFIAIVDKTKATLHLFSTATRWFAVHHPPRPYELVFRPYVPKGEGHLGDGTRTPLKVSPPDGVEAISWELPLGQPVLSMTIDQAENKAFVKTARESLANYIHIDSLNAVAKFSGLQQIYWPLIIRTNKELKENGIAVKWFTVLTPLTHLQLRSLAPLVATLLRTFEGVNDADKVAKLGGLLDILPQDDDLNLVRQIIKDGIEMQAAKGSTVGNAVS